MGKPRIGEGTSSRPKVYLLDALPRADLGSAKLPKTGPIMLHFFHNLIQNPKMVQNSNKLTLASKVAVEEAARETVVEVKRVWKHHFGLRVIEGREYEYEYYLKMFLLSHQFRLSEEEREQVRRIVIIVIINYARAWFEASLPSAAARN